MENKELEAYLAQMKAMGMTDDMLDIYRQQFELSMQMAGQMQQNMGAMAGMAEQMGAMQAGIGEIEIDMEGLLDGLEDGGITMAETTDLTQPEQWAIACGADLAYLNDQPLNTLSADEEQDSVRSRLSRWWDVDSKADMLAKIQYLMDGGHRIRFAHVDKALRMADAAEAKKYLKENIAEDETDLYGIREWSQNMKAAYAQFAADGLMPENATMPNLLAWDYVRTINLCRNGFDAKYLSRAEALELAMRAAKVIQQNYKSWKELSLAYQFGRYVWGGDDQYNLLKEEMEDLLSDANSPWVKLDWNMNLN